MTPARQDGLTLVEMLVVLAIVGVMAGMVMLGLGNTGGGGTEREARRLAARLRLAADETMVTDRVLALSADASGYRFLTRDAAGGDWRPDAGSDLGERRALPSGMTLRTGAGEAPRPIGTDAGEAPTRITLSDARATWTVRFDGVDARVERAR